MIRDQFITAQRSADHEHLLREAVGASRALATQATYTPRLRDVGHQAASTKAAGGPGPSGWRNSHIARVYAYASGPHALLAQATTWTQGAIPPWVAAIWSGALARPYWKTAEQRAARPTMRTEGLAKLAFGIVASSAKAQIEVAAIQYQYGAGRPAGAENEIAEIRAAAASRPDATLVSLDVLTAFGCVH